MTRRFVLACSALLVGPAHAGLEEYGPGVPRRPATQLVETACELDIDLRGALATFELRQHIANPGPAALGGILEVAVPAGGEVTGFAVNGEAARAVRSDAKSALVEDAAVLDADPAWLERVPPTDQHGAAYRVVLQPLASDTTVKLTTRYVALAEVAGGQLQLTLPGSTAALSGGAGCRASLRATAGPGASVRSIVVAGREVAGRNATFVVEDRVVPIAVHLDVGGTTPLVWTQTQPVAPGWLAALVTVLGPPITATTPQRVLFVVDGSRSMDLVGRHHVTQVIERIGAALPAASEVEAIVYDRGAARILGAWQPAAPAGIAAIRDALTRRPAANGSDLVAAFAMARPLLEAARGHTMVVVLTDGVSDFDAQGITGPLLVQALGATPAAVDVHMIVLDPATTTSPGAAMLRAPVHRFGGAFVELDVDHLGSALAHVDEWLRPAWVELASGHTGLPLPTELRAGSGFTRLVIMPTAALRRIALTGHTDVPFRVRPRAAPGAPAGVLAALALAHAGPGDTVFLPAAEPSPAQRAHAAALHARAVAATPVASLATSFAVLTTRGRAATARRKLVLAGGKYERMVVVRPPIDDGSGAAVAPVRVVSAIAKETLARLFRDQLQPRAYHCYQRALARDATLAGTARFQFRMGRGEVSHVTLVGLGEAQLDACLLDAAYALAPPLPDFTINADDRTIANYPLTFARRENTPVVVLGDADSASPLDIEAIQQDTPRGPLPPPKTDTPLGDLRPQ